MPYTYASERDKVFTEDGQVMFLKIRDKVKSLLTMAGAVRVEELFKGITGSGWTMLACIDRMVELKELREVTTGKVAGQDRVFVAGV